MARTPSKVVKSVPSSDEVKVTCFTKSGESGEKYIISQNPLKMQFTLWKCLDSGFERMVTSNNPMELDKKIPYEK